MCFFCVCSSPTPPPIPIEQTHDAASLRVPFSFLSSSSLHTVLTIISLTDSWFFDESERPLFHILDAGAGELINPNKTYAQVAEESAVSHDKYVFTHKDYYVGERVNRSYTNPEFSPYSRYGKPTPHDTTGKMVRNTLKWTYETEKEKAAPIVSKRVDDYREKSQPQLGQVHDP